MTYPFQNIEPKWQQYWEKNKTFHVTEDPHIPPEKRKYILDMFPYPSGDGLHVGHPEGYTATDIYTRYLRMNGYAVLHPMGFDSFGLPAENYAMKTGTHPEITTKKNITNFKKQLKQIGFSYDWDREIQTHIPSYYRWTQWLFLQLYKQDLAYVDEIPVWYCPALETVLANEEVLLTDHGPRSEMGGHPVERKPLRQWMLRITHYAERLLNGLDALDWPESIKTMQRNWIGKSVGASINFIVDHATTHTITVFTTRPDTIMGATYIVLAPEHPLVTHIVTDACHTAVSTYCKQIANKSDIERSELNTEKTGVHTGAYAIHPITQKRIPIWIADYVLITYGTGAVMAVPAHDTRDFEFARTHKLPRIVVVTPDINTIVDSHELETAYTNAGYACNSHIFDGLSTDACKEAVITHLETHNMGKKSVQYRLRDWIFSRQRYWGEPIPMICHENDTYSAIHSDDLPITLPQIESYKPSGTGESPLATIQDWVHVQMPDGSFAKRETNTMPQWAGSCWYYLRFTDPHNTTAFADMQKMRYWLPVDVYVGGAEHAVLHLLYARFWHMVLFDIGLVPTAEPFLKLINQGMITSFAYQRADGSLLASDLVDTGVDGSYIERETQKPVTQVVAKMSKSLKNVVNPNTVIQEYGADTLRLYEMFLGPLTQSKPWSTQSIIGVHRFLERIWRLKDNKPMTDEAPHAQLLQLLHQTIKKVTLCCENFEFNTAISQLMILINQLYKEPTIPHTVWHDFLCLLAPYAPHIAEELWECCGHTSSIAHAPWPSYDEALTLEKNITIVLQINGKVRSKITCAAEIENEALQELALHDARIAELTSNKVIKKIIIVPKKLVNIVM